MAGWRGSAVFFVLTISMFAGLTTGCGGDSTGGDSGGSDDTDENQEGNGEDIEDDSLTWVPFGPNDPDIPTPSWPAYNPFADGNCPALEEYTSEQDLGDFGRAMVALCFAAVEGQQDRWDELAQVADGDPSTLANDCLAPLVSDLIWRALAWHQQNPGENPEVQFNRVEGQTNCGERSAEQNGTNGESETEPTQETEDPDESEASPAPEVSRGHFFGSRGSAA